jgi:hypothetical protein
VPGRAHDRQAPRQPLPQQTPCSQKPLAHSVAAAHALPFAFLPQLPPLQTLGDTHCASAVQVVRQLPPVPQRYAPQLVGLVVLQTPAPSQVRAGVNTVPAQVEGAQVVPIACSRQPPLPLQKPSVPQLAAPMSAHWFKGSCPAGTALQVPTVPASAQERQVPAQAVAQQTPSSQNVELHSAAEPQAAPIGFLPQLMAIQVLGDVQSVDAEQLVRQALVPQT